MVSNKWEVSETAKCRQIDLGLWNPHETKSSGFLQPQAANYEIQKENGNQQTKYRSVFFAGVNLHSYI